MDQFSPAEGYPQQPVHAEVVSDRYAPPRPPKKSKFAKLLVTLLLLGFLGSVALNLLLMLAVGLLGVGSMDDDARVREVHFALNRHGSQKVAVISIEGTILSGEGFFRQQIQRARKDIEAGVVKAIVLRVNSPGGTISGSDYMLYHLRKLAAMGPHGKIPIVVSMGGIAASGGYYVSMCVGDEPNTIFAEPSTWTGSIGVIIPHFNVADLMGKWGIQEDAVASHRLKGMGSITRKMTPEEREILQKLVDDGFRQFKDVVKQGRPRFQQDEKALDKLATGQVFDSEDAVKNGLVDKIGFVEDAIDQAIRLAKLNPADVNVVKYKEEPRLSELLFGESQAMPAVDLAAVLEAATPRAYYLCTWLPALAGSAR
jgi:protease IV